MAKRVLIIGGGIAGLVAAVLIKKKFTDSKVVIIEASSKLGGLLKSFNYAEYGSFDYGTHYLMETGIAELDDIFQQVLPTSERHVMTGFATDISGVYYRGKLQTNTPFPDVRSAPDHSRYIASLFAHLNNAKVLNPDNYENALEYFEARFGKEISAEIISPIIEKVFATNLSAMSAMGTKFIPLTRIGLFDIELMNDLVDTEDCSKVLAFTDQRLLPEHKQPKLKAFYPKKTGIGQLIDGFERVLSELKIEIKLNTQITHLEYDNNHVKAVSFQQTDSKNSNTLDVDLVINASGIMSLPKLLKLDGHALKQMNPPFTTALVHLVFTKPLDTNGLYYFYCYDKGFHTFRVTDYHNFTSDTSSNRGFPITLEMVFQKNPPSKEEIIDLALNELHRMNVIDLEDKPLFRTAEILNYGFPLLTQNNVEILANLRKDAQALHLENFIQCGALSEPDVYFQKDILLDTHRKISSIRV